MIIDISRKVFLVHLRRMITLMVFTASAMLIMLLTKMPETFFGLNKYQWVIVLASVYIVMLIAEGFLEYKYIYFTIENDKIILRYFSLGYFSPNKRSIEIPVSNFARYEFHRSLRGLKNAITLYAVLNNKEARYPKISLSLLNKKEQQLMRSTLDGLIKK